MATPAPGVDAPERERPSLSRFAARVLAVGTTPDGALTPLELRLLKLTSELFINGVMCAQIAKGMAKERPDGQPVPVTAEIVAEGARFALAAAVEIEQPRAGAHDAPPRLRWRLLRRPSPGRRALERADEPGPVGPAL
jgi:hypothetical protein